jgi:hypothetical protein
MHLVLGIALTLGVGDGDGAIAGGGDTGFTSMTTHNSMNLMSDIEFGCELGPSDECLKLLDLLLMVLEADSPGVLSISVLLLGAAKLGAEIGSEFNLFVKG